MTFVQIIEFTTTFEDEMDELFREWEAEGAQYSLVRRVLSTADRDKPNTFLKIVEFDSYEAAMQNSERPETAEFSAKMVALCEGMPIFRNLDGTAQWALQ